MQVAPPDGQILNQSIHVDHQVPLGGETIVGSWLEPIQGAPPVDQMLNQSHLVAKFADL